MRAGRSLSPGAAGLPRDQVAVFPAPADDPATGFTGGEEARKSCSAKAIGREDWPLGLGAGSRLNAGQGSVHCAESFAGESLAAVLPATARRSRIDVPTKSVNILRRQLLETLR